MNTPKRHHYVPQMLLRRFTDENGRLFVFDKRNSARIVLRSTLRRAFFENDLYTRYRNGENKDRSVELALAAIEGQANGLIEKIVSAARAGQRPNLTTEEKSRWDWFFCCQWRRVPDVMRASGVSGLSEAEKRDFLSRTIIKSQPDGYEFTSDDHEFLDDPLVLSRILQSAKAQSALIIGKKLLELFAGKGLCVAIIESSKRSFVIGTNPVVEASPSDRPYSDDPDVVHVWLPLAHDVAITPAFSRSEEKLTEFREKRWVRWLNESTFNQSTAIAGRSRRLVESLARNVLARSN